MISLKMKMGKTDSFLSQLAPRWVILPIIAKN